MRGVVCVFLAARKVLFQSKYVAICGSDNMLWKTAQGMSLGHEFSGYIEDPGTFPFKKGARACAAEFNPCGKCKLNILALQYPDSGKLSTDVPDVDTGIDWLVYLARYSQQCQAQSHFVVRSRLDIVENTEIMVGPNQSFYCGTLRPDCRPFRTGIFINSAGTDRNSFVNR